MFTLADGHKMNKPVVNRRSALCWPRQRWLSQMVRAMHSCRWHEIRTVTFTHPCINWAMHVEEVVLLLMIRVGWPQFRPHTPKIFHSRHEEQLDPVHMEARTGSLFFCAQKGSSSTLCGILQNAL